MPPPTKIVRFDPRAHSFAGFRTGISEVDEFFHPRSGAIHDMRAKRMCGVFVAADEDGKVVGCVAYTPRSAPEKVIRRFGSALWKSRQRKPLDRGNLDGERDLVVPAVRIVILGVGMDSQNKGVGSGLLGHVLAAVTAPFYYLHPLASAVSFYEKFGFRELTVDPKAKTDTTIMYKVDDFPE